MDNDEDFIRDVVEGWLADNLSSMAELVQAVKAKNAADINSLAHAMKGSAAVISAHALSQAALQLETAGRDGKLENAGFLLTDMQAEFDALVSFLSQPDWMEMAKVQISKQAVPGS